MPASWSRAILLVSPSILHSRSRRPISVSTFRGLAVILEAQNTTKNPVTDASMTQAVKIIQNRVNKLGVAEAEIQRQGTTKISVQLPGIDNPDQALLVIGKTAVLEFFDVSQFGTAYTTQAEALKAREWLPPTRFLRARPSSTGDGGRKHV